MRVLNILTVWNEIDLIPYQVEYCRKNGLEIYVIDNMSDDGTWEWLQEHNIPSHRIDTNGSFDLNALQREIETTTHKLSPDWLCYTGCDLFTLIKNPLIDEIKKANQLGYNKLAFKCYHIFNTGETLLGNIFDTYFMGGAFNTQYFNNPSKLPPVNPTPQNNIGLIIKYHPDFSLYGDDVNLPNPQTFSPPGILINYGYTKSAEKRNQTLARRQKAWSNNETPKGWGFHYRVGNECNWVFPKENLIDLRTTEYYPYIQKLQQMFNNK
jgi:hypothetical protein